MTCNCEERMDGDNRRGEMNAAAAMCLAKYRYQALLMQLIQPLICADLIEGLFDEIILDDTNLSMEAAIMTLDKLR